MPRCKHCKEKFIKKYFIQPYCLIKDECIKAFAEFAKVETQKQNKKIEKQKDKELKDKVTVWKKKLQSKINEIIRVIDYGLPCIARGNMPNQMHAGHVYSRGSNQSIKFNLHNIHRQSAQSNHFQADDTMLRNGIINEYGQDYMNFISELRRTPVLKYSNEEYHSFYINACKIFIQLNANKRQLPVEERIDFRNKINELLNIYEKEYLNYNYETQ